MTTLYGESHSPLSQSDRSEKFARDAGDHAIAWLLAIRSRHPSPGGLLAICAPDHGLARKEIFPNDYEWPAFAGVGA